MNTSLGNTFIFLPSFWWWKEIINISHVRVGDWNRTIKFLFARSIVSWQRKMNPMRWPISSTTGKPLCCSFRSSCDMICVISRTRNRTSTNTNLHNIRNANDRPEAMRRGTHDLPGTIFEHIKPWEPVQQWHFVCIDIIVIDASRQQSRRPASNHHNKHHGQRQVSN